MIEAERRIREALADEALHDEGASVSDTLYAAHVFEEACSPENIAALLADRDEREARLIRERDEARAERDALRDVLLRHGFVPCDIPACNCGSWHARFGYPERLREIADALDEAGHPLSNENGNMPLNALRELIAERDALAKDASRYRYLRDDGDGFTIDVREEDDEGENWVTGYPPAELDAAIDAQIEQEKANGTR